MKKLRLWSIILLCLLFIACSKSAEEQRKISQAERHRLYVEDSLALKIAVLPTLDCLPIYIAQDREFFKQYGVDVRLRSFTAQADCDTAFKGKSVEGMVSDFVRTARLKAQGYDISYGTTTNAYWLLFANQKARIQKASQLGDKMIAYSKYSVTDYLTSQLLQTEKTKAEVFLIPVDDVNIRLSMLLNNEMDALWLPEPQATIARNSRHVVISDSRKLHKTLGVIVFNAQTTKDAHRRQQITGFWKAYNQAIDSLNRFGYDAYKNTLYTRYELTDAQIQALPQIKFSHATKPKASDFTTNKED